MPLLEIYELRKYFKKIKAVDDISFSVEKGDIVGLLGPNGAGKSTTISMIATLLAPDSGSIRYNGEDILKKPKSIRQSLGLVPQEIALYPSLSGRENLDFWGKAYGLKGSVLQKHIDEVSEIIGITDRLKDKVKKYSGGMKRRLNIGAALLHEPEFIIMDEPTVGIDPQSRNHILDTVKALAKNGGDYHLHQPLHGRGGSAVFQGLHYGSRTHYRGGAQSMKSRRCSAAHTISMSSSGAPTNHCRGN